jgi:hypothetical protein
MHDHHIEGMVRRLKPVLKDESKAKAILERYWKTRMALVWEVHDVHRAANELGLAITKAEAIQVLQTLLNQHNAQYGLKWEDITTHIQDNVMGRKLTKRELDQFVKKDIITVNK